MTIRTMSLLMLFVAAFGVAAVLVAAIQPVALRFGVSTPWMVPLAGIACYSVTFFLGRRYILPEKLANSAALAMVTLIVITTVTMTVLFGVVWLARTLVGGLPGALVLALWFAALWVAIRALHRLNWQSGPLQI